ncbi:uncharacterized protein LOC117127517 [Brassica rapa]|uniref:uncharacterized protein LOC117127517 n=1 Tax=Brassica campestris TaxID=3711 RepID=UPI0004F16FD2|nr:uncharacterized protein LOC117127517 [Brassica rapa]
MTKFFAVVRLTRFLVKSSVSLGSPTKPATKLNPSSCLRSRGTPNTLNLIEWRWSAIEITYDKIFVDFSSFLEDTVRNENTGYAFI